MQASVAALEEQLASKESEVAELQQQSQTHASSAERLGGELASLQGQLDEMEDMNTRLEAAAAETANQRDEAQAQISSMEQREADLVQQVESLTADVETMRNASSGAEGLQASVADLERVLEKERENVVYLDGLVKEKDLMIGKLNSDIEEVGNGAEMKLGKLGTELEEFRSLYERSKEELNALQGEKDGLVRDLAGREQEYSGQHEQLQSEVLQLRTKLQEMAHLDENYTASVNEVQALQTLVESLRGENLQLVSQSKDQTELTESVLNEKDQYLAELEDLLAVNEKLKEEQRVLQSEFESLRSSAQPGKPDDGEALELKAMNDDLRGKNQSLLAETDSLRDQIYEINKQVEQLVSEQSQERQEREALEQNYAQLQARYVEANESLIKSPQQRGQFTNKKNEDDMYDVEAALVSGGSSGFMPMVGLFRSLPSLLQLRIFILVAQAVDKVTIAVHTKPGTRLGFWLYTLILHLYVILSVIV